MEDIQFGDVVLDVIVRTARLDYESGITSQSAPTVVARSDCL
jgi:hypothetical protein